MEYKLGDGICEQDVIDIILKNIRVIGWHIIGCSECPFALVHKDAFGDDINIADPDEGHYDCGLTGKQNIWGENPTCDDADWGTWLKEIMLED